MLAAATTVGFAFGFWFLVSAGAARLDAANMAREKEATKAAAKRLHKSPKTSTTTSAPPENTPLSTETESAPPTEQPPTSPTPSTSAPQPSPSPSKAPSVVSAGTCRAAYYEETQDTASGERFDPNALTAAHRTLPMHSKVRVSNPQTGQSVVVRINDRGPFVDGLCLDMSRAAFGKIGNLKAGMMQVRYEVLAG
ncbi:septal ring lytic transglycosylase RlpA family protein [Acrocarpospora catenulata]|uniref:septal ring lytic transglycosylase RlpA family protein n=1 Tax=Acrocarpospora catenulata TaxID=2836182 RepID=UPI0027E034D9|nr:septal ring lytic transglycosylase RlpA family protein [Acrocarpospora catenulata]